MVDDSLDEEGEEMVADDAKKGSIPIRLVNQAKSEGIRGGRSQGAMWKQSDQDQMGRHEQGNARETKCSGSMSCTGLQMD